MQQERRRRVAGPTTDPGGRRSRRTARSAGRTERSRHGRVDRQRGHPVPRRRPDRESVRRRRPGGEGRRTVAADRSRTARHSAAHRASHARPRRGDAGQRAIESRSRQIAAGAEVHFRRRVYAAEDRSAVRESDGRRRSRGGGQRGVAVELYEHRCAGVGQDRPRQSTGRQHDPGRGADAAGVAQRARSGRCRVLGAATATRTGARHSCDVDAASARDYDRRRRRARRIGRNAHVHRQRRRCADRHDPVARAFRQSIASAMAGCIRHGRVVAADGRQVDRGSDGGDRRGSARPVRIRGERIHRRTAPDSSRALEQRVDDRDGRAAG